MNTINIHVGELVKKHIDTKKVYKSALARKLQRKDSAIIRYQHSASLQTKVLQAISHALKHNFFADIAAQLPATYTTTVPADNTQTERIAQLEHENALLQAKYDALVEVMRK